jgi:hypothetical protein
MDDDTHEFCNPYPPFDRGRPPAFDPAWRTETVSALAKGIEAEAAFDRLPILADALEEAGCDVTEVLAHCRDRCDHHPRCWVMDLVLDRPAEPFPPFLEPPIIAPQSPPPEGLTPFPGASGGQASLGFSAIPVVCAMLGLLRLCAGGLPSNTPNSPTPTPPKFTTPPVPAEGYHVRTPATHPEYEKWVQQSEWNRTPATRPIPSGVVIPATVPTRR